MHRNSNSRDLGSLVLEGGGRAGRFGRLLGSYFRADRAGILAFGVILLLCASFAHAQTGIRWDLGAPGSAGAVTAGTQGGLPSLRAQPGVTLAWCNHPANAVPCTNYATTYTSLSLSSSCPNNSQIVLQGANSCVATGDNFGNLGVYTASNTTCTVTCYDYTLTVNGVSYGPFVWTMGASGGGSGSLPTATAAGQYPNSTAAGTTYTAQSKGWVDVRDQGVDCTGLSDSTTAMQNMINNAPDYSSFFFPEACKVRLTGTPAITLDRRVGLQFIFAGRNGNGCTASNAQAAMLYYAQAYASGNTIFYINRSQSLEFRNMTIWTNGGADTAVALDQIGATPPITTRDDFYNLCIYNSGSRNSAWAGVSIAPVGINNTDNIHFYHPDVTCSSQSPTSSSSNGFAILEGPSSNPKNLIVDDLRDTNCSVGVYNQSTSDFTMTYGLASSNFVDFQYSGFNNLIMGFRSENATHVIQNTSGGIGPVTIIHNDFAASGGTAIDGTANGCGIMNIIGNAQDSAAITSVDCGSAGGTIFAAGNRNFNMSPTTAPGFVLAPFPVGSKSLTGALTILDSNWMSLPFRFTPGSSTASGAPGVIFDTLKSGVYDHFLIQSVIQASDNNVGLNINYLGSHIGYIGIGGTVPGLLVGPNTTTSSSIQLISPRGAGGLTTWAYLVQPVTITGHADCSAVTSTPNGNATLSGSNFNVLLINPYAGALYFKIYRTTAGGTPNTTGLIGTVLNYTVLGVNTGNADITTFSDSGLAGDGSTCTTGNTSGDAQLGRHLTQVATNFAGSCAMAASATCTFSISAAYASAPIGTCSIDAASAVPATANSCKVSVSGTTVTITAGANNSLTWDAILVGNPN